MTRKKKQFGKDVSFQLIIHLMALTLPRSKILLYLKTSSKLFSLACTPCNTTKCTVMVNSHLLDDNG